MSEKRVSERDGLREMSGYMDRVKERGKEGEREKREKATPAGLSIKSVFAKPFHE